MPPKYPFSPVLRFQERRAIVMEKHDYPRFGSRRGKSVLPAGFFRTFRDCVVHLPGECAFLRKAPGNPAFILLRSRQLPDRGLLAYKTRVMARVSQGLLNRDRVRPPVLTRPRRTPRRPILRAGTAPILHSHLARPPLRKLCKTQSVACQHPLIQPSNLLDYQGPDVAPVSAETIHRQTLVDNIRRRASPGCRVRVTERGRPSGAGVDWRLRRRSSGDDGGVCDAIMAQKRHCVRDGGGNRTISGRRVIHPLGPSAWPSAQGACARFGEPQRSERGPFTPY